VCYHGGECSLIDDALSAVDAHVAKHLFEECIVKNLLECDDNYSKKRSVILATNSLQHLNHPRVDKIVVLRQGRIIEQGSYKELSADKSSEFSRFLSVINESGVKSSITEETVDRIEDEIAGIQTGGNLENSVRKSERSESEPKLMTVEERLVGHVGIDVYMYWARAAGSQWIPLILILIFGIVECINFLSKWW
jgi:ABC-type dipeptide/oligopeptide/nickel transport system ATPase component